MSREQDIDEGRDWDNEDTEKIYDEEEKEQQEYEDYDSSFWEELNKNE